MTPGSQSVLRMGLMAGLVLYLTVALFFAGLNVLMGRSPLFTAQILGQPLLGSPPFPLETRGTWTAVMAFNGVHLAGSLALGMTAALLTCAMERARRAWYFFFLILVAGSVLTILALRVLTAEVVHVLAWRSVITAHLAGAVTTTAYLLWAHQQELAGTERHCSSDAGNTGAETSVDSDLSTS